MNASELLGHRVEITHPKGAMQEYRTVLAAVPDSLGGIILTFDADGCCIDDDDPEVTQLRVDVNDRLPDATGTYHAAYGTGGRPSANDAYLIRIDGSVPDTE